MDVATIVIALLALAAGAGAGALALRRKAERERARAEEAATRAASWEARALALETAAAERRRELEELRAHAERERAAAREEIDRIRAEAARAEVERARALEQLEAERRAAAERSANAEQAQALVRAEVKALGQQLLEEKGKALLDRSEGSLRSLLDPLAERLKAFEAKVDEVHRTDIRERASLKTALEGLQAAQQRLSKEADALSRALTGQSKAQGDWGELVLEQVLQAAGLEEGREYVLQETHLDDDGGRKRPDAVILLPEERALVVDAKCSLTAWVEATRATEDEARERSLDAHAASVRKHVAELAGKRYAEVIGARALEVVFLFVPNEPAFHAALQHDPALYRDAFQKGIVIASPTTLLAAMQIVTHLWRTERQNEHAREIAEEAGKLLEKLAGFVGDVEAIGTRLEQAQQSYRDARSKLDQGRGNLVRRAGLLVEMGAPIKNDKVRSMLAAAADADGPEAALPPGPA